jgi:signal transduction histidine kinase
VTASPFEPEPWGEDPKLEALLGVQGSRAMRELFDAFPEAVGLLWAIRDDGGRIVDFSFGYGNPAILRLFRLTGSMHERFTLLEALPQMRDDGDFAHYVRVCETGVPYVDEVAYDTPFGDGYMRGTFTRRTAKLGDGLLVLVLDITRQRRLEAELRGFADIVAHDLREPITGIAHLVTLLERRDDEPPDPAVLRLLRASTERGRELIDGVLTYARAGEMRREQVALGELMADVRDDLRLRLDEARATLAVDELPEVRGDARQLRRVLQNLVVNAVKFRADAPPRINVSAAEGQDGWIVTVADNGRGVAPKDSARIFGMFSRAHHDLEGSGIGLAVCRRVVEAHGGRMWVEPADGGGSAFRFTLPQG